MEILMVQEWSTIFEKIIIPQHLPSFTSYSKFGKYDANQQKAINNDNDRASFF